MNDSEEIPPSVMLTVWNSLMYELEILILTATVCVLFPFTGVMLTTKAFDVNLRVILIDTTISIWLLVFSRFMIITPNLVAFHLNLDIASDPFCWFSKTLHDIMIGSESYAIWCLMVERSIATIFVEQYETNKYKFIGAVSSVFKWTFATSGVLCDQIFLFDPDVFQFGLSCMKEYSSNYGGVFAVTLLFTSSVFAFIVLLRVKKVNSFRYKEAHRGTKVAGLSERYQTAENIHTFRLLCPLVTAMFLFSLGAAISLAITFTFVIMDSNNELGLLQLMSDSGLFQLFDIVVALYLLSFPIICLTQHPSLLKRFRMLCGRKTRINTTAPLSINGTALNLPQAEATDEHFRSMEAVWNKQHTTHARKV